MAISKCSKCGIRLGAAAFVAGLSLAGSPGFGIAFADAPGDTATHSAANVRSVSTAVGSTSTAAASNSKAARGSAHPASATASGAESVVAVGGSIANTPGSTRSGARAALLQGWQSAAAPSATATSAPVSAVPPATTSAVAPVVTSTAASSPAITSAVSGGVSSHPAVAAAAVAVPSAGTSTVAAAPSTSAVVAGLLDSAGNWLAGLPANPVTNLLQGALLLLRRNPVSQAQAVAAVVSAPAATSLPITVNTTNSFTTIHGTTAAGTVTVNGDTWIASTTTHLYTTTTNLAQQWQTYYSEMKAGQGSSLNDIQRLEGNAEAVFENTGLKSLSAAQLSTDRQDVQREFDALEAAMVGAGVNLNAPLTQQQYLSVEQVLQSNPTLLELAVQGHGLNNSGISRYAGYTNDFQNNVDNQSLYVGGGLNNGDKAIADFFDDNVLSHVPFPTVVHNGVLWQLNQNGNRENTVTQAVTALDTSMSTTYTSSDFVQPPQLENKTAKQVVTAGRAFSFALATNTFVDLQSEAMTYVATLENAAALPSWLSFNAQTEQFSGTMPTGTQPFKVYVTATNSSGLHTTEAFVIQSQ